MNISDWFLFKPYVGHVEQILVTLGREVKECSERINKAKKQNNFDYLDVITDDECAMIEELIGLSFVVAQVHITAVVSDIIKLHDAIKKKSPNANLKVTNGKKGEILQFDFSKSKCSEFTEIEVINAAANYYKHKDESGLMKNSMAKVLRAIGCKDFCIGCKESSTGNFRLVAKVLKIKCDELQQLSKILQTWQVKLYEAYKTELISNGLLKNTNKF